MWLVATTLDDTGLKDPKGTTGITPLTTSIWHLIEAQAGPGYCLLSPIWFQSLFVRMLDTPYSLSSLGVGFCQELFPSLWAASIFHLLCLSLNATFSERSCRWHYPRRSLLDNPLFTSFLAFVSWPLFWIFSCLFYLTRSFAKAETLHLVWCLN